MLKFRILDISRPAKILHRSWGSHYNLQPWVGKVNTKGLRMLMVIVAVSKACHVAAHLSPRFPKWMLPRSLNEPREGFKGHSQSSKHFRISTLASTGWEQTISSWQRNVKNILNPFLKGSGWFNSFFQKLKAGWQSPVEACKLLIMTASRYWANAVPCKSSSVCLQHLATCVFWQHHSSCIRRGQFAAIYNPSPCALSGWCCFASRLNAFVASQIRDWKLLISWQPILLWPWEYLLSNTFEVF